MDSTNLNVVIPTSRFILTSNFENTILKYDDLKPQSGFYSNIYDDSAKTLQIGSTGADGTLKLGVAFGASLFGISGPKTLGLGASYTLEFPIFKGNLGEVFVSLGDGTTAWATLAPGNAGSIQLTDGAGGLVNDNGFIVDTTTHTLYVGTGGTTPGSLADANYFIDTPSSGGTVDLTNTNPIFTEIIDPAGTLATLTVKLPNNSVNGQILRLKFTQIITALTISPNTGDSVKGAPTSVALGGYIDCQFTGTAGSGTWYC